MKLPTFRVASLPGPGGTNPYIDLFYAALVPYGVQLCGATECDLRWVSDNIGRIDAVHFHWPELFWRSHTPELITDLIRRGLKGSWRLSQATRSLHPLAGLFSLTRLCRQLRKAGVRILWTLHNLEPHERPAFADRLGYRLLAKLCDLIICHTESARTHCHRRYRTTAELLVMPIGNYDGVFPEPHDRRLVVDAWGLDPNLPIIACLGYLREYKGLDVASEAAAILGDDVQLVVAGPPHPDFDIAAFRRRLAATPRAVLAPQRLTNQEFADLASVSDIILLPYRRITGSAALMAALSLGRGVVASDLPFFREILAAEPLAGALFPPGNARALASTVRHYLTVPADQRQQAARRLADRYKWADVIAPVLTVIRRWQRSAVPAARMPITLEEVGRG
jgi:beta-1,4-mannosyltransferase